MWKEMYKLCMPRGGWLMVALAFVLAAGVATPLVAQAATVKVWNLGAEVTDLRVGPSDEVWTMAGDKPRRLLPATNELTTYTHPLAGIDVLALDGSGRVWSPDSFSPPTTYVMSRLDPTTLEVTSWPTGDTGAATSIAVDAAGDVWFARSTTALWRLHPATNTITKWTLPISSVSIGSRQPFDTSGRVWLKYSGGVAVLDPSASYLTYWAAPSGTWQGPFAHTDGNVWFAVQYSGVDSIARLNPSTNQVTEWPCRAGCDVLGAVRVDSEGKVWFTEDGGTLIGYVGRLDPAATPPQFTEWPLPCSDVYGATCPDDNPRGLVFDTNGDVWLYFEVTPLSRVARLTP